MVTWAGLITALILRANGVTPLVVSIAGGIHGFIFLSYGFITVFVWVNERWKARIGVLGLVSAVIPFATVPFELAIDRRKLLSHVWRLGREGATPVGVLERLQAWVLRHPFLAMVIVVIGVAAVFATLLWLGPPVPRAA